MANANTSGAIRRITKELQHIQRNQDLSLAVSCRDKDVRSVRALIIGPPETAYEYGFFEFEIKFGKDYPIKSPSVRATTTNGGRTRFNPNIYNEGKVCLSILGTWRGEPGEQWSSAQGLESTLLSIQSLMSTNPYENEPGYETAKKDEPMPTAYIAKIRHETLRIAVIQRLENLLGISNDQLRIGHTPKRPRLDGHFTSAAAASPEADAATIMATMPGGFDSSASTPATEPSVYEYDAEATFNAFDLSQWDPFADLIKRRFLWYYDTYLSTIEAQFKLHKAGTPFTRMEFEYPPNSMEGAFDYPSLRTRLDRVKEALSAEEESWVTAGKKQVAEASQLATQLAFQFKQLEHKWHKTTYTSSRLELSLPDPTNPFRWNLTLFGKPLTNLDGGIFNLALTIPPSFPTAQPRVKVLTPIFHHRVSPSTGTLCYFPKEGKEDEIGSHLEGIVAAIEGEEGEKYDPRAVVHPEAFTLFWGGEDKKRTYHRKLRRSAQESCEFN